MILGRENNTQAFMKSFSSCVRTAEPVNLFYFRAVAVPGVGWGMHGGEARLSKSSRLDVHVQEVMEFYSSISYHILNSKVIF